MTFQPSRPTPSRPSEALVRIARAALVAARRRTTLPEDELRALYPGDESALTILKAAVAPATLTSSAWAGVLASTAVADFVAGLAPASAAARLIESSLQVSLGRNAEILVPGIVPNASAARFIAENKPIPVTSLTITGATLRPDKLAVIAAFTRETAEGSAADPIIRAVLREVIGLALDAAMFSSAAAVEGERPAGLLAGLTPIAAAAGGGENAMIADLTALALAVAGVAGSSVTFVASPGLAFKIGLRKPEMAFRVLTSAALTEGTIIAVAANALAVAIDPVPEITASRVATLHMDSTPSPISTAGTPNVVAAPTASMFQVDAVALRIVLGATWGLRASGAVAVVNGASW